MASDLLQRAHLLCALANGEAMEGADAAMRARAQAAALAISKRWELESLITGGGPNAAFLDVRPPRARPGAANRRRVFRQIVQQHITSQHELFIDQFMRGQRLDSLIRRGDALILLTLNELFAPDATVRIVQCSRAGCGRFLVQDYSTSAAGAKSRYCPPPLGPHGHGCKLSNAEKLQRLRAKRNSNIPLPSRRSKR